MKYLVTECHPSYAVLLDEDGRFIKAANLKYEVGQTVTQIFRMRSADSGTSSLKKSAWRIAAAAAALAACIALVFTFMFSRSTLPYASVYLTINPEVRIDVNKHNSVVGLEGINEDGKTLVEGYSYKDKQLDPVVDDLIDLAIEYGYLYDGGQITFSFDSEHNEWVTVTEDNLNKHVNEYLSDKLSVTIVIESPQTSEITIPVAPSQNESYGDSDYGDSGYNDSDSQSDYGDTADSDSTYEAAGSGYTDYGGSVSSGNSANSSDSGYASDSGYEDYDSGSSYNSDSGYESSSSNSNYGSGYDDDD